MKIKYFVLLFSIQFVALLNCNGYDFFQWSGSYGNASQQRIIRFGPDDSLYIGSRLGLHVYKDTTVSHYIFYPDAGRLVNTVAFDSGFIWIGTENGLVKRIGIQYQVFNTSNSGIFSNDIRDVMVYGSQVYVACDSGLSVFDGVTWINYSIATLGLSATLNSVGKNTFGVYVMDRSGTTVYNNSNSWHPVINTSTFLMTNSLSKFRNLNGDTLLFPHFGGYLVDSVFHVIPIPIDPCLFKDELTNTPFLISNPVTGEKFVTIYYKFLVRADNFGADLADIRDIDAYGLGGEIGRFAYDGNLYDFDSSGKLYWVNNSNPRGINSVNLSLDSFPSNTGYEVCPYLDVNQVRAKIMNNGGMFWDYEGDALYEVPKGSGITSIFCQGLWIGGLDQNNQLHLAAQTYRQSGADFWPGPLDTITATIDSVTQNNYDTIWKIDRSTIDNFIWRFATGQVQNGTWAIPDVILNWPAEGLGNYSRSLAPYYDFNQDGHYNPYDGDYPEVKGSQMIWSVFNDNFAPHGTNLSDRNLGVEIQSSAYAYNCPMAINDDSVINYTTFYHYEIINRSDTDYHDVYIGNYTDVDLGNYLDDYIGCDTVNDFGFGYNGDDSDEGLLGYGLHPPMINNLILQGPDADLFDGIDNDHDGISDEQGEKCMMNNFTYWNNDASHSGNPQTAMDHYYRLQSRWKDGSHVVTGGSGLYTPGGDSTHYMFSAVPYSGLFWSEFVPDGIGSTPNTANDRRFLISSGPFSLNAHEKKIIDFAYVYTRDPNSPNGLNTSIAKNSRDVLRIKQFYESNSFPCDNVISVNEVEEIQFSFFPNPADQFIEIVLSNKPYSGAQLRVTDILGQLVFKKDLYGERKIKYSTENLASGIYLINIISGDQMLSKKFVVQHSGW